MIDEILSVRAMNKMEFNHVVDYFLQADKIFLEGVGVDVNKLPERNEWLGMLLNEFDKKMEDKKSFFVIWLLNNHPIGHSNINKIIFGEEAYMHLHLWEENKRKKGAGIELVKKSLPFYFENFKLKELYCEPYAFNPAPNKTLQKIGFDFIKQYETVPGWINSHQMVNRWRMGYEKYKSFNS